MLRPSKSRSEKMAHESYTKQVQVNMGKRCGRKWPISWQLAKQQIFACHKENVSHFSAEEMWNRPDDVNSFEFPDEK